MKKFKAILSSAKERERADRDNTRQHLGFAGTSGSSGTGPSWSQTPNVAPPSVPGPSSAQPQRPLNNNAALGTFPSAMMRALPGPNTAAQIPARPINAPSFPQQPQQYEIPSENGIQTVSSHKNWRINPEIVAVFSEGFSNPNAAGNVVSPEESALIWSLDSVFCRWCDRCKSGM